MLSYYIRKIVEQFQIYFYFLYNKQRYILTHAHITINWDIHAMSGCLLVKMTYHSRTNKRKFKFNARLIWIYSWKTLTRNEIKNSNYSIYSVNKSRGIITFCNSTTRQSFSYAREPQSHNRLSMPNQSVKHSAPKDYWHYRANHCNLNTRARSREGERMRERERNFILARTCLYVYNIYKYPRDRQKRKIRLGVIYGVGKVRPHKARVYKHARFAATSIHTYVWARWAISSIAIDSLGARICPWARITIVHVYTKMGVMCTCTCMCGEIRRAPVKCTYMRAACAAVIRRFADTRRILYTYMVWLTVSETLDGGWSVRMITETDGTMT